MKIHQMLVLPDNDFKAVIIKCLDNQLLIFLKPEVTITAKKPKQTTKKKTLLDRLDSRVQMTEGRSEELEQ